MRSGGVLNARRGRSARPRSCSPRSCRSASPAWAGTPSARAPTSATSHPRWPTSRAACPTCWRSPGSSGRCGRGAARRARGALGARGGGAPVLPSAAEWLLRPWAQPAPSPQDLSLTRDRTGRTAKGNPFTPLVAHPLSARSMALRLWHECNFSSSSHPSHPAAGPAQVVVMGRRVQQPRQVCYYADGPALTYTYSGLRLAPHAWDSSAVVAEVCVLGGGGVGSRRVAPAAPAARGPRIARSRQGLARAPAFAGARLPARSRAPNPRRGPTHSPPADKGRAGGGAPAKPRQPVRATGRQRQRGRRRSQHERGRRRRRRRQRP
jgi:hypothetical protein